MTIIENKGPGLWGTSSSEKIEFIEDGNHRLLKFDREGNFLWKTGRKGQGPGEFEYPGYVFITNTEDLAVEDGRSLHFFNNQGEYQRSTKIGKSFTNVTFLPDGRLFINLFLRGQPGISAEYYSPSGEILGSHKLLEGYDLETIDSEGKFYFTQRNPFPRIIRKRLEFK